MRNKNVDHIMLPFNQYIEGPQYIDHDKLEVHFLKEANPIEIKVQNIFFNQLAYAWCPNKFKLQG